MVLVDYSITDTYTQVSVPHLSGPGSGAGLQPSSPGLVTRSWATPGAAVMTFGPGAPQGIRTVYDPEREEFGSGLVQSTGSPHGCGARGKVPLLCLLPTFGEAVTLETEN